MAPAPRAPLREVADDLRPVQIARADALQLESRARQELEGGAVQVTATAEATPAGGQAVLPSRHGSLGGAAVLHEEEPAVGAEHATELVQDPGRVGHGAEGERTQGRVEASVFEGQLLRETFDELRRHGEARRPVRDRVLDDLRRDGGRDLAVRVDDQEDGERGDQGGRVVATGTPEQVAQQEGSYTGEYLRRYGLGK